MNRLCAVYKSPKKDETYLYLPKKDDFSAVPEALMASFGRPQFVMLLPLEKRARLARIDTAKLVAEINDKGFYLQLPPPKEDLLKAHRQQQKTRGGQDND